MRTAMRTNSRSKMTLNIGPQHPSTHGVLRLLVELEGEKVLKCTPCLGYLHRGLEKAAQDRLFSQYLPMVDRVDYLAGFFYSHAYLSAIEELSEIELPKKAQYIRVLTMELNRISSHLLWFGAFLMDLGAAGPIFYAFNLRNEILNIFEKITGARMMHNYYVFGGVRHDISKDILKEISDFTYNFNKKFKVLENIVTKNPIFLDRTRGLGALNTQNAFDYSITGPNLRASGYNLDFRKEKPYLVYDELEFYAPTAFEGDCHSRYLLRVEEIKVSINLVNQCLDWLLAHESEKINLDIKPLGIKPKAGRAVSCVESARGLVMCHLVTDGGDKPKRVKWRTPSFYAVQSLEKLLPGNTLADFTAILGSLDIVLPEADR